MLGHTVSPKGEPLLAPRKRRFSKEEREANGTSVMATGAALFKATVGIGIFALPPAIRASGFIVGTGISLLMAAVSYWTTWAMVEAVRAMRRDHTTTNLILESYSDGRIEFMEVTGAYSPKTEGVINFFCVINQIASVLGFFLFVCDSVDSLTPDWVSRNAILAATALLIAPLALLKNTSHVAFQAAMTFGNFAVVLALGTVVGYGLLVATDESASTSDELPLKMVDADGTGLMFGVGLLMFSCHLEAITIEQDMKDRAHFDGILGITFIGLAVVFSAFGVTVYSCFGEATGRMRAADGSWAEATIMNNLEAGAFVALVKVLMSINLVLMSPVTLLPASRAIEALLPAKHSTFGSRSAVRLLIVGGMAVTAAVSPGFETVAGLTGALGGVTCFTLPALCYCHFCKDTLTLRGQLTAYAVIALGVGGSAYSFAQQAILLAMQG